MATRSAALAIIALGTLLVRSSMSGAATAAGSTAPRWLGWLSIVSGIVVLSIWLAVANGDLLVLPMIGVVLTLITELALAGWLLRAGGGAGDGGVAAAAPRRAIRITTRGRRALAPGSATLSLKRMTSAMARGACV